LGRHIKKIRLKFLKSNLNLKNPISFIYLSLQLVTHLPRYTLVNNAHSLITVSIIQCSPASSTC